MPEFSIVICTYNRVDYIARSMAAIGSQDAPKDCFELIVVDNNSTDGTTAAIHAAAENLPEGLTYTYHHEPKQGLSHARNAGIGLAKGRIIAFIDDDAIARADFVRQSLDFYRRHPGAMALGGRVNPLFVHGEPEWMSRWTRKVVSEIDFGPTEMILGKKYPFGANMSMRAVCFERHGLFDPELGRTGKKLMGGEEKDFFDRMRHAGEEIWYSPNVYVDHVIERDRLTEDYIRRFCTGVGRSERVRLQEHGRAAVEKKRVSNYVKMAGALGLSLAYTLMGRPARGKMIRRIMRWIVKGYDNPAAGV